MSKENNNKEVKNKENDEHEHCGECGCGDHSHDHSKDMVNEDTMVHLVLEDDTEMECEVLGIFEVEEDEYIALLPTDEDQAEGGVLLYKYVELNDEEFDLVSIDEDEEFEKVADVFYDIFQESDDHNHDHEEYGTYDDLEGEEE